MSGSAPSLSSRAVAPWSVTGRSPRFPPAPSKIPYGGFSPVRLQNSAGGLYFGRTLPGEPRLILPSPLRRVFERSPLRDTGRCPGVFSLAVSDAIPRSYLFGTTTLFHGSFALHGLCCPLRRRYYDPIRQSRMLPTFSRFGYMPSAYASETFPTFTVAP